MLVEVIDTKDVQIEMVCKYTVDTTFHDKATGYFRWASGTMAVIMYPDS